MTASLTWDRTETDELDHYAVLRAHPKSPLILDPDLWSAFEQDRLEAPLISPHTLADHRIRGECSSCGSLMRKSGLKLAECPGTVRHGRGSLCSTCAKNAGTVSRTRWDKPCLGCGCAMRPATASAEKYPNTKIHSGNQICVSCRGKSRPPRNRGTR